MKSKPKSTASVSTSNSDSNNNGSAKLWVQSSWKGAGTLQDMCQDAKSPEENPDADASSFFVGSVGLYVLYGSWNAHIHPRSNDASPSDGLLDLLSQLLYPHARHDVCYRTGQIQVDSCDEELDILCCDSSTTTTKTSTKIQLPCPPEQLPVLMLVLCRTSMDRPEIRYMNQLSSGEILQWWKGTRTKTKKSLSTAALDEVSDALYSFGLGATTLLDASVSPTPTTSTPSSAMPPVPPPTPALRIFVAGDRMSVGKTSVCLGLLGSLVRMGYPTESLAYIKPATQNEKPQLVQLYCERMGIPCVPIGPIVYYRGFTRAFLAGETEPSEELLARVGEEVDKLAAGKRVVIVDGVGFPAVGSICGTDNASVARASGYPSPEGKRRRPIGALVVGGPGVGGAVDAFNLNATYFERVKVPVLGAIFNKLSLDGFYSLENCKREITTYFTKNEHQQQLGRQAFGFVPLYPGLAKKDPMDGVFDYIRLFQEHVDLEAILQSAGKVLDESFPEEMDLDDGDMMEDQPIVAPSAKRAKLNGKRTRTRAEIENEAISAGAAPSA